MAKFQEKTEKRSTEYKDFAEGAHIATIISAKLTHTTDGIREKMALLIGGEEGETGFFNVTFGDEFGEEQWTNVKYLDTK